MHLKKHFYCLLFIVPFFLISCPHTINTEQSWTFDNNTYLEMYNKWQNNKIDNYSFEYSISDVIPDSVIGKVKVINGIGTCELIINGLEINDDGYETALNHYSKRKIEFKSIDELYKYIESIVEEKQELYNTKKLLIYKLNINYDFNNNIPLLIDEDLLFSDEKDNKITDGNFNNTINIKISKFEY